MREAEFAQEKGGTPSDQENGIYHREGGGGDYSRRGADENKASAS